ncbi:MAG: transposase family protein [Spirochaetales bacterium]|nr:transposase family protein [Spirochaetales bacterium]
MSFKARRELLIQIIPRYLEASHKQKKSILDEFVLSTGYSRKYAIRLLSSKKNPVAKEIKRSRAYYYGTEDQEIIKLAWSAANFIAAKRLAPFLKELIPALERHGHIKLDEKDRKRIISISASTIDRILHSCRKNRHGRGISTTRSGLLLKKQIPVRTFADWKENKPGFFEADLVAHCGTNMSGSFLYTLVLTDVATGWVECLPLLSRHQGSVIQAIRHAMQLIPFPILGIDTDNGSEFINRELITFLKQNQITFTRGRSYKKNDQCFVEQKNGVVVRQLVGYDRFNGMLAYKQLNELYRATRLYVNFFQPSMKLQIKHREGARVHHVYDAAKTPFHRLLGAKILSLEKQSKLEKIFESLDPIYLLQQIKRIQDALWQHAVLETDKPQITLAPVTFNSGMHMPSKHDNIDSEAVDFFKKAMEREKRTYRHTKKTRMPHTWRTRKNPFKNVWDQVCFWLEEHPERTVKSIFKELKERYPGKYKDGQLRTMQRYVKAWRSKAILTFDYEWMKEYLLSSNEFTTRLHGKITREAKL